MSPRPRLTDAVSLAAKLHAGQTRKGTDTPYLVHLSGVCARIVENGGDEDEAIAALLHDAVEDHGGTETLALIRARFGDRVAGIVDDLSDSYEPEGQPQAPWRDRKQAYLDALPGHSASSLLVSVADKVDNATKLLRALQQDGDTVWETREGGRDGTLWYYRMLRGIFEKTGPEPLATEFGKVVEEIESLVGNC